MLNLISIENYLTEDVKYFNDTMAMTEMLRKVYVPYDSMYENQMQQWVDTFNLGNPSKTETKTNLKTYEINSDIGSTLNFNPSVYDRAIVMYIPDHIVRRQKDKKREEQALQSTPKPSYNKTTNDNEDGSKTVNVDGTKRFSFTFGNKDLMKDKKALAFGATIGDKEKPTFGFNVSGIKKMFRVGGTKEDGDNNYEKWVDSDLNGEKKEKDSSKPEPIQRKEEQTQTESDLNRDTKTQANRIYEYVVSILSQGRSIVQHCDLHHAMVHSINSNKWYSLKNPENRDKDIFQTPVKGEDAAES